MARAAPGEGRVPALVVSGFLGAGKTTLVRTLLEDARARGIRLAVISNEFGELGIDRALLGAGEAAYVELEGGCVCCRLSDALLDTLEAIRERVRPERLVIETSGVALPFEVQLNLWREPVSTWIDDDPAVVVVDATQVAEGRDLAGTWEDQVASADLLLLSKVDLLPPGALAGVRAALAERAPETPVVRSDHGRVDPDLLFAPAPGARRRRRDGPPPPHAHEVFESEEIRLEPGLPSQAIEERLRELGALRAKGFARSSEGPVLVQGVGRRINLEPVPTIPPGMEGRIVLVRRAAG